VLWGAAGLGGTVRDHYRNLVDFANEHDLDMASAYSVLLGIELIARLGIPESLAKLIPEGHESQTDLEASGLGLLDCGAVVLKGDSGSRLSPVVGAASPRVSHLPRRCFAGNPAVPRAGSPSGADRPT